MKNKKAQVTIFVIIAIVVLAILILLFVFQNYFDFRKEEIHPEVRPVYSFVDDCITKTGNDAIYNIGQTGGYFIAPDRSTDIYIAYHFDRGENLMPSLKEIENELSKYMDEALFFCSENFIDFPEYDIEQGKIKTETSIERGRVVFNIKYPLSISKGDKTYTFDNFNKEIPVRLDTIYSFMVELMKEQLKEPMDICITCIDELAAEKNLLILINEYGEDIIIFSIYDDQSEIRGDEYVFYFANRYELGDELDDY